tara:strand:- start:50 stop:574 length:525 start_codon:yes stop_codon:yes gene_type:complete
MNQNKEWEYRVICTKYEDGRWLSIQEVYYDDDGKTCAHTTDLQIEGETILEMREQLIAMLSSLDKEMIDELDLDERQLDFQFDDVSNSRFDEHSNLPQGTLYHNSYMPDVKLEKADNDNDKWIYESPDGGETIYRRKFGEDHREKLPTRDKGYTAEHTQLWQDYAKKDKSDLMG